MYPFIQAHKSNHACDKVDAAVKKLPQKIVLSEATRLSTWPTQFKDSPAMEENIALFFFAENLERYTAIFFFYNCFDDRILYTIFFKSTASPLLLM